MSAKAASVDTAAAEQEALHAMLRFAVGVTVAFVLCEALRWGPSFLAPVFTAVFLINLPMRPPWKMALSLVVVMVAASLFVFALASLLYDAPIPLVGCLSVVVFIAFRAMASGRARLPALLLLICVTTIPVIVTIAPAQAGVLPAAMIRSMALAMVVIQVMYMVWPRPFASAAAAAPAMNPVPPARLAAFGTIIVVPLMTVYLLFGLTDALPVLIATVLLVANFDPARSRMHALGMVVGNLVGGVLGIIVHMVLQTTPTLIFLALLLFLVLMGFGKHVVAGGSKGAVALVACNAMLIILGASIASGPASLSLWLTRLGQFVLASLFAVGMMNLIWHREPQPAR